MGKQPYIPFYIGDYLKDTRILPLSVRGAWVDLILYMWESPTRGVITGTIEDYSRLMSCDKSEATFALDLLKQKLIADFDLLPDGVIKITSRKMFRDAQISKIRSDVGRNGVEVKLAKQLAEAKQSAKLKQNPEYEYEIEYEGIKLIKSEIEKSIFSDERAIADLKITHPNKDLRSAWNECWAHHSVKPNPPIHNWEWKQKLNTWLSIKKEDKKVKKGGFVS